jgi:hypothetical protein
MTQITITTAAFDVTKRDGSFITIQVASIPPAMFEQFALDGVAEYIRDSSSTALANAYTVANPDCALEGPDLLASRKTWGEGNAALIAKESEALMIAASERLYSGERRAARTTQDTFSDIENEIYTIVSAPAWLKAAKQFPDVRAAFTAAKGLTTPERKALALAAVMAQDEARVKYLTDLAAKAIAARANLASLDFTL